MGDAVLRALAAVLTSASRDIDFVGRTGGEEFVVLLTDCGLERAIEVANRILRSVAEHDWASIENMGRPVTASVGLTVATDADDVASLLRRADQALYRAKDKGRNRVEVDAASS